MRVVTQFQVQYTVPEGEPEAGVHNEVFNCHGAALRRFYQIPEKYNPVLSEVQK